MVPLLKLNLTYLMKRYESGNDLFSFFAHWIATGKTGNTGAEKLSGRTHLMLDGVYPLYRLIEGNSMKSYGAEKTNRNSTINTGGRSFTTYLPRPGALAAGWCPFLLSPGVSRPSYDEGAAKAHHTRQRQTLPSAPAEAAVLLSGDQARALMTSLCSR